MSKHVSLMAILAVLLFPMVAMAKPLVSVSITAEKEVTVVKNGQKSTKKVAATRIDPGDIIFYTMNYINSGDEAATGAVLDDPIPRGRSISPAAPLAQARKSPFPSTEGRVSRSRPFSPMK